MGRTKKPVVLTPEEQEEKAFQSFLSFEDNLNNIPEPTRLYQVGDKVTIGALTALIDKPLCDGKAYRVRVINSPDARYERDNGKKWTEYYQYFNWVSIFKYRTKEENNKIEKNAPDARWYLKFQSYKQELESLLFFRCYRNGVDMNPEYQRDLVWTLEDKVKLIDSIFNDVEIGKFAFVLRSFEEEQERGDNKHYEILDGKQRLTALCEFYEDKFEYKGKKYSEMNTYDQYYFNSFPVTVLEAKKEHMSLSNIYLYFLRLNTSGKPVEQKYLDNVQKLYEQALKEGK